MPRRVELVRGKLVGVPPELLADGDAGTATETGERLYAAEDLLTMPKGFELVRGKLVGGPRKLMANNPEHVWITSGWGLSWTATRKPGGSLRILAGCGFVISRNPDTLRTPDIAVVGEDRYRTAVATRGCFPGVPDPVIEGWGVTVCRPDNSMKFYRREDTLDGGDLLPGFRLPPAKLFPN